MNIVKLSAAALFVLSLASCGGSSSNETTTPPPVVTPPTATVLTGIFVDSAVFRIGYKTASGEGFTNEKGEFNYQEGETVTFYIGETTFAETTASSIVTLLDIAGTDDVNNAQVANMARLLQTLDKDGDPSNGIEITQVAQDIGPALDFDVSIEEFAATQAVLDFIANAGQDTVLTSLIPLSEAIAHLAAQIEKYGNIEVGAPESLVGSWFLSDSPALAEEQAENILLIFTPQGHYYFVEHNNPTDGNDFEFGSYEYKKGVLKFSAEINQNTEIGPTNSTDTAIWELKAAKNEQGEDTFAFQMAGETGFFEFTKDSFGNSGVTGIWQPTDMINNPTTDLILFGEDDNAKIYVAMSTQDVVGLEIGEYLYESDANILKVFPSTSSHGGSNILAWDVLNVSADQQKLAMIDPATNQLVIDLPKYNSYSANYRWEEVSYPEWLAEGQVACDSLSMPVYRDVVMTASQQHHPLNHNQETQARLEFIGNPIPNQAQSYVFNLYTSASGEVNSVNGEWTINLDLYGHAVFGSSTQPAVFSATTILSKPDETHVDGRCLDVRKVTATETSAPSVVYNGLGRANRIF